MNYNSFFNNDYFKITYNKNILLIKFLNKKIEEDNIDKILDIFFLKLDNFYIKKENKKEKFGKIYDISELNLIPLTFIHKFSKGLNKFRDRTNHIVVSSSVIVQSLIIRSLLNIFLCLYNNTRPLEAFNNINDCETFILQYFK